MRYTRLSQIEASILKGEDANYNTEPFSIPVKGEALKLDGVSIRPANNYSDYYYDEKTTKEKIVLHFTVGHLKGDLSALTSPKRGHVSVPFVIARDGTIYQLFSSAAWSYHLGKAAIGGNEAQSKKTIGIELSNYGPLTLKDGNLETAYSRLKLRNGKQGKKDIYCAQSEKGLYVKLDTPYRGHRYFATFTDAQYDSLITLLRYLTAEYKIPRHFLEKEERYEATDTVVDFRGIVSHVNYRTSGKWDLGPAFDWDRVIAGVQAMEYTEETKHQKAIYEAKKELMKAKRALTLAQKKVKEWEDKIEALENTPAQPRSLRPNSLLKSEK